MIEEKIHEIKSSFRDPSGSLFLKNGVLYRRVNPIYKQHYDCAQKSGLFDALISNKLLIAHQEIPSSNTDPKNTYKIIAPEKIPFISYPYEWCFSQLQDAAILTLEIKKIALDHGMTLKDASAYNVQFLKGRPIFIDTLSFEIYKEGAAWAAYRQFCQHFLAPLALMCRRDVRLNQLLRIFIDGIPLDLASSLLPRWTYLSPTLASHIHLHAKGQQKFAKKSSKPEWRIPRRNLEALIESLKMAVQGLKLARQETEWANYYQATNYSAESFTEKKNIVSSFLREISSKIVWDLGANTGEFSRLASDKGVQTISFDIDPTAVEKNYLEVKNKKETNLLPLLSDLTNPSPGTGWNNEERLSLRNRGPADAILALALVHHMAISNNTPFGMIAECFSQLSSYIIIEFIPKSDSQVERLLATREDIFPDYHQTAFESEFGRYFDIQHTKEIPGTKRTLYLMKKKS